MALFVGPLLPVSVLLTLGLLLYVFLYVGRRGRHFPDGKDATTEALRSRISKIGVLQRLTWSHFRPAHIASDRELTSNAKRQAIFSVCSHVQDSFNL